MSGGLNGGRFSLGFWADSDMTFGLEGSFLFTQRGTDNFSSVGTQASNPFVLDTGATQTLFLIQNGVQTAIGTGSVLITRQATSSLTGTASNQLYGAEGNVRSVGLRYGGIDFGGLVGFRYLYFSDDLALRNDVRISQPVGLPATGAEAGSSLSRDVTFSTSDNTRIKNNFYGGQVGVDADAKFGAFFIYARGTIAAGNNHTIADIDSRTLVVNNDPARPQSPPSGLFAGGLLGGPNDNGRRTRDTFAFIPEVQVKVGYQLTNWLRGSVGYNGIFLNNFQRAGSSSTVNTLNTDVTLANSTQNVNVAQPTFRFNDSNFYIQGVTFGLEARY